MASLSVLMWGPRVTCHHRPVSAQCHQWEPGELRAVTWARARALRSQAGQAVTEECWAGGGGWWPGPATTQETGHKPQPPSTGSWSLGSVKWGPGEEPESEQWDQTVCQAASRHVSPASVVSPVTIRGEHHVGPSGEAEIRDLTCAQWEPGPGRLWVFCVQLTAERSRVPGARADSLGLRWEEKLDRDMGIFMNQIILDQNWEKLMGSLYSLGKCGCAPTAYSS